MQIYRLDVFLAKIRLVFLQNVCWSQSQLWDILKQMRVEAKEGNQPLWGYSEKVKHQTWVYNLSGGWQYQVGGKRQSRTMCRESLFQMTSEYWTIKIHQHHAVNAFWDDHWTQQHNRYFSFKIRKTSKCPWKLAEVLFIRRLSCTDIGVAMPILDPMGERVLKTQVGCIWKNLLVGLRTCLIFRASKWDDDDYCYEQILLLWW
jgi:hypothetical protein